MTKQDLVRSLSTYSCILLPEKYADIIEEELKKENLTLDNLKLYFVYNRENEVEVSLMTTPSSNIRIRIQKSSD